MSIKIKVVAIFTLITILSIIPLGAVGVGNSGSFGGFSSGSSGGSSFGGSSFGGSSYSSDSEFLSENPGIAFIFIVIFVLSLVYKAYIGTQNKTKTKSNYVVAKEVRDDKISSMIRKNDPNFSKYEFLTYARHVIIEVEEAIEDKKYDKLNLFCSKKFIEQQKNRNINEVYDGQEVVNVTMSNYLTNDKFEYIEVQVLTSEIRKTKRFKRDNYANKMIFRRRKNSLTNTSTELSVTNCPSCGAPNSINEQSICTYCGADINSAKYSFILIDISPISVQSTIYYSLYNSGNSLVHNFELETLNKIRNIDANFNQQDFEQYVADTFIEIQEAWEQRDINKIRQFESEQLYLTHSRQIEEYIEKKQIPYIDTKTIKNVHLNNFEVDGKSEYMTVYIDANVYLYLVDEETNDVIKGSKHKLNNFFYMLRYKRSAGLKSNSTDSLHFCPNCGAPLNLNESGVCEYCNSTITSGKYDWILDSYERIQNFNNISQRKQERYNKKITR